MKPMKSLRYRLEKLEARAEGLPLDAERIAWRKFWARVIGRPPGTQTEWDAESQPPRHFEKERLIP
jgi:hypothetical protein